MEAKPKPESMRNTPDDQFRLGVGLANEPHVGAAFWVDVSHQDEQTVSSYAAISPAERRP
jgi:hypothetical protein